MRRHLSVLLFSTFLAGPALAQATPPQQQPAEPAAKQQQMQPPASQAGTLQFMQQQQASQWSADWLIGSNVYNREDESLGSINDLILDSDGRTVGVVIGVGGFLGIGEKNVAVDFAALNIEPVGTAGMAGAPADQAKQTPAQKPVPQTQAQREASPTTGQATPQQDRATRDDNRRIYMDVTREQLDQAPEFEYNEAQRGTLGGAGSAR